MPILNHQEIAPMQRDVVNQISRLGEVANWPVVHEQTRCGQLTSIIAESLQSQLEYIKIRSSYR